MSNKNTTTKKSTLLKKEKKHTVQYDNWGYFFIAPFFLIYVIFSLIPLLTTIIYSFFEYYRVGLMTVGPNWVGFKNYIEIFTAGDSLASYFKNTLLMWMMGFIPQILISLLLAVWFTNTELRLKGQQFFKTVIYMPNLIMAAAFSMLFFNLFSPNGPVNNMLKPIVDKANIPNITLIITTTTNSLKRFVTENAGDVAIEKGIAAVIDYLSKVEIPKGLNLEASISYINQLSKDAVNVLKDNYNGPQMLNIGYIISNGIHTDAAPMEPIRFFVSTGWTRTLIAAMNFLMWYGNTTIMLMAGVMGIDNSLFEAARIDGANPIQIFFKITIPLLLPIFVYVLITSLIGGIQMFDVPNILLNKNGGPKEAGLTLVMYLNNNLQGSMNYGTAGAISVVLFILTGILSVIAFKQVGS